MFYRILFGISTIDDDSFDQALTEYAWLALKSSGSKLTSRTTSFTKQSGLIPQLVQELGICVTLQMKGW